LVYKENNSRLIFY